MWEGLGEVKQPLPCTRAAKVGFVGGERLTALLRRAHCSRLAPKLKCTPTDAPLDVCPRAA
ncbi:MAG: hypothetical protein Kow00123_25020 [Anaerolineales bacterium]